MFADTSQMDTDSASDAPAKRGAKVRLLCLGDLDGRTKARKAADKLLAELISDMGGDAHVSAGRRALAEHAAILAAMAEHQGAQFLSGTPIDIGEYTTTTNALRRLLTDIGLERRSRDVTPPLADYISRQKAAA